jgi:L-lactate permease
MTLVIIFWNWMLALSPVLVVLIMMLGFRSGGGRAGALGWLAAVLVCRSFLWGWV